MAVLWYGHFNSTPQDERKLQAADWARYIQSFITDGIRNGGTCLQVTADSGMRVRVNEGQANVQGYILRIDRDYVGTYYPVAVPAAHNQYPRIDRLVLRLDLNPGGGKAGHVIPIISQGTAASAPSPPALRRDNMVWELSLAQIRVNANATAISAGNITDERLNTSLCGLINSALGLDPSMWQAQFDAFMAALTGSRDQILTNWQNQLSQDRAGFQSQWQNWFGELSNLTDLELVQKISFYFENQIALPGTVRAYTESGTTTKTITEQISWSATGKTFCEQVTVFNTDNSIVTTQRLYWPSGVLYRAAKMTTTFPSGNPRSEVVIVV